MTQMLELPVYEPATQHAAVPTSSLLFTKASYLTFQLWEIIRKIDFLNLSHKTPRPLYQKSVPRSVPLVSTS